MGKDFGLLVVALGLFLVIVVLGGVSFGADPNVTLEFRTGEAQGSWQVEPANPSTGDMIVISGPSLTFYGQSTMMVDKAKAVFQLDNTISIVPADDAEPLIFVPGDLPRYIFVTIEIDELAVGGWTVSGMFPALLGNLFEFSVGPYSGGDGSAEDPWRISCKEDLLEIKERVRYHGDGDDCFVMTSDVNMAGEVYTDSLIQFGGVFDGNGFKITGLIIQGDASIDRYLGLFGYVGDDGEIKNLGLEDVSVSGDCDYVGSLAGYYYYGNISNCYSTNCNVSGNMYVGGLIGYGGGGNLSNCYAKGTVEGDEDVGILVGHQFSPEVIDCYSSGTVSGNKNIGGLLGYYYGHDMVRCSSKGIVSGGNCVGGLVGYIEKGCVFGGTISDCNSKCAVSGGDKVGGLIGDAGLYGEISECYSTGDVVGDDYVGGLMGSLYDGDIVKCYSTGDVEGYDFVGGLAGSRVGHGVMNCYSAGRVNGNERIGGLIGNNYFSNVLNCYSTGDVNGVSEVGGLVGCNGGLRAISNSFWDIEKQTHGVTQGVGFNDPDGTVTNVSGLTTSQMQQKATYTTLPADWDFVDVWGIGENQTYPYLRQYSASDINQDHIVDYFDLAELAEEWLLKD